MATTHDAIIIGAGQAGPPLAARMAKEGLKCAVIERKHFGGTCVNAGCIPTKALVESAHAAHLARRADAFGIAVAGPVTADLGRIMARKDAIVMGSRNGVRSWMEGLAGATVIQGHARFLDAGTVEVAGRRLTAPRIFINTGGRAFTPAMPGLETTPFLTNSTILDLDALPEHLLIVGGSYIGLEFAQVFRRFGGRVTVAEMGERLIGREDPDVSDAVQEIMEGEGIDIRLNAKCIAVAPEGDRIAMGLDCTQGPPSVSGTHLLLAVGRRPNTDDLGLEAAGIKTDARGFIVVDEQLRTSAEGVWAIGEVNGRGAFTHTSYNDYEIVAANLLDGEERRVSDRIACYALFTDPPLGRVGMTQREVKAAGIKALTASRPMTRVTRARLKEETAGFMQVTVEADTGRILGAAILGAGGDEVVQAITGVMAAGAPYTAISRGVYIHPTVAEYLPTLLQDLKPLA
jgi:pyruvate/2-oxoglutarate dehydrogenase complex dihydrolipoamide dehydrogenase (E3) component